MGIGGTSGWFEFQRARRFGGTPRAAEMSSNGQVLDARPIYDSAPVRQELSRTPAVVSNVNPAMVRNKQIQEMNMAGAGVRPGMRLGQNAVQSARAARGLGGSMVNMPPGMMNNPRFAALGPYGQAQAQAQGPGGPPQAPPGPPPAPMGPPTAPPLPDQVQTQSRLAALAR